MFKTPNLRYGVKHTGLGAVFARRYVGHSNRLDSGILFHITGSLGGSQLHVVKETVYGRTVFNYYTHINIKFLTRGLLTENVIQSRWPLSHDAVANIRSAWSKVTHEMALVWSCSLIVACFPTIS